MTITVTQLTSGTNNSAKTSFQVSGVTASVGDWLIVAVACDNAGSSGAVSLTGVTDSASHTYTQRSLLNNDPGAVNAGVTLGVYSTPITTALNNGSITASFSPATTAIAIQVWRLQSTPGAVLTLNSQGSGAVDSGKQIDNVIFGASANSVVLVVAGIERAGITITPDSDVTQGSWSTKWEVTGGGSTTDGIVLVSQYKITTGSSIQNHSFSWLDDFISDFCANYFVFYETITQVTLTDTGVGTDLSPAPQVNLTATDTGAGTDLSPAPQVNLTATDTGAGTDQLVCAISVLLPDTATATDVISLLTGGTIISLVEAGTGESLLAIGVQIPMADTGAGADTVVVSQTAITLIVTDAGAANEIVTVLTRLLATDAGAGTEIITSFIYLPQTDAGMGSEAATVAVHCPLPDTGVGADTPEILVRTTLTDAGAAIDAIQLLTGTLLTLLDTGAGADVIQSVAVGLGLTDTGAAADVTALSARLPLTDTGAAADTTALSVRLTLTDSASGAIAAAIQARILGEDVGSGLDAIAVTLEQFLKTLSDLGQGSESLTVQVTVPVIDLGAGDILVGLSVLTTLVDAVHGTDIIVGWDSTSRLAFIRFMFRQARVLWTWRQRFCDIYLLSM